MIVVPLVPVSTCQTDGYALCLTLTVVVLLHTYALELTDETHARLIASVGYVGGQRRRIFLSCSMSRWHASAACRLQGMKLYVIKCSLGEMRVEVRGSKYHDGKYACCFIIVLNCYRSNFTREDPNAPNIFEVEYILTHPQ